MSVDAEISLFNIPYAITTVFSLFPACLSVSCSLEGIGNEKYVIYIELFVLCVTCVLEVYSAILNWLLFCMFILNHTGKWKAVAFEWCALALCDQCMY